MKISKGEFVTCDCKCGCQLQFFINADKVIPERPLCTGCLNHSQK